MASVFPDSIDSFKKHYDPSNEDLQKIHRYEQLRSLSTKTNAQTNEFEQLTKDLAKYMFTSEDMNTVQDAMVNLETYFKNKVDGDLTNWENEINESQANLQEYVYKFTYSGEYSDSQIYNANNVVRYNNSLYTCLKDNVTGVVPTDTEKWVLMMPNQKGDKGDKGDPGLGLVYRGTWQPSIEYAEKDAVTYEYVVYYCKTAHTSGTEFDFSNWEVFLNSNITNDDMNAKQDKTTRKTITLSGSDFALDSSAQGFCFYTYADSELNITNNSLVIVSPFIDPSNLRLIQKYLVLCISQDKDSLTFISFSKPNGNIKFDIVNIP